MLTKSSSKDLMNSSLPVKQSIRRTHLLEIEKYDQNSRPNEGLIKTQKFECDGVYKQSNGTVPMLIHSQVKYFYI